MTGRPAPYNLATLAGAGLGGGIGRPFAAPWRPLPASGGSAGGHSLLLCDINLALRTNQEGLGRALCSSCRTIQPPRLYLRGVYPTGAKGQARARMAEGRTHAIPED